MEKIKKILGILIGITAAWILIYSIFGIIQNLNSFTSFPWWSVPVFVLIYFGPVLLVELVAYGIICIVEKRKLQ